MDAFLATIMMFGGNFAPRAWAMCNGQLLSISQLTALFSLLGTTYGGDGRTTFALPDLRGRAPIGYGHGAGLSSYQLGQHVGNESLSLTLNQLPTHTHAATVQGLTLNGEINVTTEAADSNDPSGAYLANTAGPHRIYNTTRTGTATLASDALSISAAGGTVDVANSGSSMPVEIIQPSIAMNYIICLQGLYPSRN